MADVTDDQMDRKEELDLLKAAQEVIMDANAIILAGYESLVPANINNLKNAVDINDYAVVDIEASFNDCINNYTLHTERLQTVQASYDTHENKLIQLSFQMYGVGSLFYPLRLLITSDRFKKLNIYRSNTQDESVFTVLGIPNGCFRLNLITAGNVDGSRVLRITNFEEDGSKCIGAIGQDLYGSVAGAMPDYHCTSHAGIYLRGGIGYTIESNDADLINDLNAFLIYAASVDPWITTNITSNKMLLSELDVIENDPRLDFNHLEGRQEEFVIHVTPGDRAIHSGGMNTGNLIQQSIISTGGDATNTGTLVSNHIRNHAITSSSVDDLAIHSGGINIDTIKLDRIQRSVISSGSGSVYTGYITVALSGLSSTSNGSKDVALHTGGCNIVDLVNTVQRSIISTGEDSVNIGILTTIIDEHASTSNAINDIAIYSGGKNATITLTTIGKFVISTGTSGMITGSIGEAIYSHSCTSNGTDDKAIHCGGYPTVNDIKQSIVSTGASSTDTGILTVGMHSQTSTSNGTDDIAIHAGGNDTDLVNTIQQSVVSTGVSSIDTGIMSIAIHKHASTSNG